MGTNKKITPSILYHYTSVGTLLKIVDINDNDKICLRATNAKYFNDPHEYSLAISLLKSSMISYEKEKSIENKISQNLKNKLLTTFSTMPGTPFILSLSENPDNLTMWRTYGVDGKGVSIGFDKDMLENYAKDENNTNTRLYECVYEKDKIFKGLLNYWSKIYNTISIIDDNGKNSIGFQSFRFLFDIVHFSFQFKRSEYNLEREWRLCKNESIEKNYRFIERDGIIIPFVEHYFPKSIIKKIIIGPCTNKILTKKSILTLLKSKEFQLDSKSIITSNVPYRKL